MILKVRYATHTVVVTAFKKKKKKKKYESIFLDNFSQTKLSSFFFKQPNRGKTSFNMLLMVYKYDVVFR